MNYKTTSSAFNNIGIGLLHEFVSVNSIVHFMPFKDFCDNKGIIIEYNDFLNLLKTDRTYIYNKYSDLNGHYWLPAIIEGYINNTQDSEDDDQIDGIADAAYADVESDHPMQSDYVSDDDMPDLDKYHIDNAVEAESIGNEAVNSFMPRLYQLVNTWQNGTIDQHTFEQELHMLSSEPTISNSNINVSNMVDKILSIKHNRSF